MAQAGGQSSAQQGWSGRVAGGIAGLAVGFANIGAVLANVDQIRRFLWGQLGLLGLENLLHISAILVIGALAIYLIAVGVIYVLFVRGRRRISIAYLTLALLMAPVIGIITFREFGPSRTPAMVNSQIERLNQTTLGQFTALPDDLGAFRFSLVQQVETPQAWTSAQALAGLLARPHALSPDEARKVRRTLDYIAHVRTRDGWGYQDGDSVGVTEIAGWAIVAESMSLDSTFADAVWGADSATGVRRVFEHLAYLAARQHEDGGWGPIARSQDPRQERTYSSIMALMALLEAAREPAIANDPRWAYDETIVRGARWLLLHAQTSTNGVMGWFPNPSLPRQTGECLGLTAQAIFVLQSAQARLGGDPAFTAARRAFLEQALQGAAGVDGASPVADRDFHNVCRAHDTDIYLPGAPDNFRLEPSTFLWYPWSMAAVSIMASDPSLTGPERNMTRTLQLLLAQRIEAASDSAHQDQALYVVAETLYAANVSVRSRD